MLIITITLMVNKIIIITMRTKYYFLKIFINLPITFIIPITNYIIMQALKYSKLPYQPKKNKKEISKNIVLKKFISFFSFSLK